MTIIRPHFNLVDGECKQNPACVNILIVIIVFEAPAVQYQEGPHCISGARVHCATLSFLSSSLLPVEYSALPGLKVVTSLHLFYTNRSPGHVTLLERVFVYIGPAAAARLMTETRTVLVSVRNVGLLFRLGRFDVLY